EPVIRVSEEREERALDPIVDPWVEEYETRAEPAPVAARAEVQPQPAAQPAAQGDLYADRAAPAPAVEDDYDDRDHRRSGWSLFGRGKRAAPQPAPTYPAAGSRTTQQLRPTAQPQPMTVAEDAPDDDLEIPSFLRRLAN